MARTAFYFHPEYLEHQVGANHPECPERLVAIMDTLDREGLLDQLGVRQPGPAPVESLTRIHSPAHIEHLARLSGLGRLVAIGPDTGLSPSTFGAACLAAGAGAEAIDAVMAGEVDNAFCAVRPPGHHAERDQAMGFCYLNNAAIGARHAQERHGLSRVAILDWDVHHGNGTQHSFEEDPSVFFFSIHQFSPFFYPGTGAAHEQGRGPGLGYTLNAPVPPGATDADFLRVFRQVLRPAIDRFRPEFILLSAGFDAHRDDPLGELELSAEGFAELTAEVRHMAEDHCQGRLVSLLEGGYDFAATAAAVAAHLRVLMY
ncbi:MAG: histone deacetylase [Candidatus Handelsmanbacteria bacterium]|nr:histone deacetylase [Candidatus Handelsmanbacteria bacterium]